MSDCLFCKIGKHEEASEIVLEDENYIVIENKFPSAPIHLLVMPKSHISKKDVFTSPGVNIYDDMVRLAFTAAAKMGLNDGNFKIIINGNKLAHFEHEHLHLLGGWAEGAVPQLE
ncbi:MAG: HIT domain-containing protein [candidate division WWE3 bacterium]|nr:HIT domain-containing protein [candidate division WWE3 bacterium]